MGGRTAAVGIMSVVALIGAACSPTNAAAPSSSMVLTTSTSSTTTAPTTTQPSTTTEAPTTTLPPTTSSTTTTIPPLIVSDAINGLLVDDPASINRRVVTVKIDNHEKARPQSGLMEADAVYEILVEGGFTRFIAMYHQSNFDWIGPVRSGRPTDSSVVKPLDAPFQISGAQKYVLSMLRSDGIRLVTNTGATTWREQHRKAPHNLYASSFLIRDWADDKGWPDENPGNLFMFGEPTTSEDTAHRITFEWSSHPDVIWKWTGTGYARFNEDKPHLWVNEVGNLGQLTFPTLLAIKGRKYTVSPPPTTTTTTLEGTEPTPPPKEEFAIPAIDVVGTGDAILFHGGMVVRGTWSKESKSANFELFNEDGTVMVLPPSRLWVSIFPSNREITWE